MVIWATLATRRSNPNGNKFLFYCGAIFKVYWYVFNTCAAYVDHSVSVVRCIRTHFHFHLFHLIIFFNRHYMQINIRNDVIDTNLSLSHNLKITIQMFDQSFCV